MKVIATILFVYLSALLVQPFVFPLSEKKEKHSCCAMKLKEGQKDKGCGSEKDGCCKDGQCNPFYSQCPMCAVTGVVVAKFTIPERPLFYELCQEYFMFSDRIESNFQADITHPPQVV